MSGTFCFQGVAIVWGLRTRFRTTPGAYNLTASPLCKPTTSNIQQLRARVSIASLTALGTNRNLKPGHRRKAKAVLPVRSEERATGCLRSDRKGLDHCNCKDP